MPCKRFDQLAHLFRTQQLSRILEHWSGSQNANAPFRMLNESKRVTFIESVRQKRSQTVFIIEIEDACAELGFRKSASMISTRAPVRARLSAVFTAIVVRPSPGTLEVTSNDFNSPRLAESNMEVRNCR